MKEIVETIKKETEKQLRIVQGWNKACVIISKEFRSGKPDAALLKANLDRLQSWPEAFPDKQELFQELEVEIHKRYKRHIRQFEGLLREECEGSGLNLSGSSPRLIVDGLIKILVNPVKNTARINRKRTNNLSIPTVMSKITEEHKRLWGRRFYPKAFLKRLDRAYETSLKQDTISSGGQVAVLEVYDILAKQDVEYEHDIFVADLSRLLESGHLETANKKQLELGPVRDKRQAIYIYDRRNHKGRYVGLIRFK